MRRLREGAGLDCISPRLLRHMCNLSLSLKRVPILWKTFCVVPVPKPYILQL